MTAVIVPAVRRVFIVEEDIARRLRVADLTDLDAGRVAVLVRPNPRSRAWLTGDLLVALGVQPAASDTGKDEDRDWLLAHVWLVTHDVRDLIVARAEWLPPDVLTELLLLAAGAGLRLWLLTSPPRSDEQVATLDGWDADELDWDVFRSHWESQVPALLGGYSAQPVDDEAAATPAAGAQKDDLPGLLPDDDFPTFRPACRAVLTGAQFAILDARLGAEVRHMLSWAGGLAQPVTPEVLAEELRDRYDRCATVADLLITARAAQVALFSLGWFVQIDLVRFAGTAAHAPRRAGRTAALWRTLRMYRQPDRGSVCALAGAGLDLGAIAVLRCADITADGSTVTADGRSWTVEDDARVYLRAQLLLRTSQCAGPDDPLLAGRADTALSERRLATLITNVRMETGLIVASRLIARERPSADRWYTQWGICAQPLVPKAPR